MVNLDQSFARYKLLAKSIPRAKIHYAVKANNDNMLIKLFSYLGAGFDCASKNEIDQVLSLGIQPSKIIFANPCKEDNYIKYAHHQRIDLMTFDNEDELLKIKENHPNAKVLLRIKTDDKNAKWGLSVKFGADLEESRELISLSKKLNVDLVGIAFHVGSSNSEPNYREEINKSRYLFDYARQFHSIEMYILNIGGGFPGIESENHLFDKMAVSINDALEEYFPLDYLEKLNTKNKKFLIMAEPGRFLCESTFTICIKIIVSSIINISSY